MWIAVKVREKATGVLTLIYLLFLKKKLSKLSWVMVFKKKYQDKTVQ